MTLPETERTDPGFSSATTILELNEAQPIGDRIFFFRNRQGDQILLDVIIPEIDPQYAYPHRIRLSEAREGVEVAGLRLRLDAVRPTFISFKFSP